MYCPAAGKEVCAYCSTEAVQALWYEPYACISYTDKKKSVVEMVDFTKPSNLKKDLSNSCNTTCRACDVEYHSSSMCHSPGYTGTSHFYLYNNCRIFTIPFVCRQLFREGKWILSYRHTGYWFRVPTESVHNALVAEGCLRGEYLQYATYSTGYYHTVNAHHMRGRPSRCIRCRSV